MADIQKLNVNSTTYDISVPWGKVTGKPSTFAPSSHTHTKSQITDFPSSMPASDVYSWAKAASKPTYTAAEVGLGNIANYGLYDSTHYSTSAGYAFINNGVMEVGNRIDFHSVAGSNDYEVSLRINSGENTKRKIYFPASEGTLALTSQIPTNTNQLTNGAGFITGITKSMVTTALGYTPPTSDTNTWRPVTNTYTGSDTSTCVSQYGTNALYNALVNGSADGLNINSGSFSVPSAGWYKLAYMNTTDARGSVRLSIYTTGGNYTPKYTELKVSNGWSVVDFTQYGRFDWISAYRYTTDSSKSYIEAYFVSACDVYLSKIKGRGNVDDNNSGWVLYSTATSGSGTVAQEATHYQYCGLYSNNSINGNGFVKIGSNDNYVLLGGGSHKAVADFAASSHTHTKSQITDFPTIPTTLPANGGNADTVDGYHASSFFYYKGGLSSASSAVSGVGLYGWATSSGGFGETYGDSIVFQGYSSWYRRLDFGTSGRIRFWQGINTTTMTNVGTLAYISDIPASLPASDVYSWAKAASKPTYTYSEVGAAPASHTHSYLPLSGGTLSTSASQISRGGSSTSWYLGRSNAMLKISSYSGYNAITSMKTTNGDWSMGVYTNDIMYFTYVTDSNFNAGNNTTTAQIYFNPSGYIYASAFYQSSDERLKTFYDPIKVDLEKLKKLRKNYFKFNDKDELEIGVSAQEIQSLYPEIVSANDEGYLSVAYDKLSVIALKAVDELNDINNKQQKEIDDLKDQLSTIKNILKEKGIL